MLHRAITMMPKSWCVHRKWLWLKEKLQYRTKKEKGNAMRETRNIMWPVEPEVVGTPPRETRARGLR